jgi:hypothetical protein
MVTLAGVALKGAGTRSAVLGGGAVANRKKVSLDCYDNDKGFMCFGFSAATDTPDPPIPQPKATSLDLD